MAIDCYQCIVSMLRQTKYFYAFYQETENCLNSFNTEKHHWCKNDVSFVQALQQLFICTKVHKVYQLKDLHKNEQKSKKPHSTQFTYFKHEHNHAMISLQQVAPFGFVYLA